MISAAGGVARTRRLLAGAALAFATMLTAACGGSAGSAGAPGAPAASGPSASDAPASPSASTAPSTAPATPTASASSPAPGPRGFWSGYSPCRKLQVTLGLSQHDPTVTYQVIDFTNRSRVTCILYGYPGVSLAAGTPAVPIGLPAAHNTSASPRPVTLTPGGVANALLQVGNAQTYARGRCGPVRARYLIVYLPNKIPPATLRFAATACDRPVQIMEISAVSRGTGGA